MLSDERVQSLKLDDFQVLNFYKLHIVSSLLECGMASVHIVFVSSLFSANNMV